MDVIKPNGDNRPRLPFKSIIFSLENQASMASLVSVLHLAHCEVDDIMIIYIFEARGHMVSGATSSSAKVKEESAMTKVHQKCSKVWKQGRSAIAAKKGTNRINKASPIGFQRNRCSLSEKAVFYCWLCQPNPIQHLHF